MKQRKHTDFTILLLGIVILVAILAASCARQGCPANTGKEPKYHYFNKMKA